MEKSLLLVNCNHGTTFSFFIPMGKDHLSENDFIYNESEEFELKPIQNLDSENLDEVTNNQDLPKLLLVEDNPELIESLAQEFFSEFNVFKASNGEDGLSLAKSKIPDIIISDVMMPVMNGHQLCIKLKSDLSICHIPIIFTYGT